MLYILLLICLASTIPKDYGNKSSLLPDDLYIIGGHPAEPRKCFRPKRFLNLSNVFNNCTAQNCNTAIYAYYLQTHIHGR